MFGAIDRFEGSFAVVELDDGRIINIKKEKIPAGAKEGYVLNIGETIVIDYEETKRRRNKIEKVTEDLWE